MLRSAVASFISVPGPPLIYQRRFGNPILVEKNAGILLRLKKPCRIAGFKKPGWIVGSSAISSVAPREKNFYWAFSPEKPEKLVVKYLEPKDDHFMFPVEWNAQALASELKQVMNLSIFPCLRFSASEADAFRLCAAISLAQSSIESEI
jgi:hypothetical protein